MLLREALTLPALRRAQVVAGAAGLSCEVRSVHMVDHPDLLPWVRPHQLLLTTGYAWPRDAAAQRALVTALAAAGLAAIGLAVPHFFEHFPPPVCDAAEAAGLPLLEIPWEIPFAQITEELHRVILAEQAATIERSEVINRTLTQAAAHGRSLQDLATTLSGLLQRAVSILDDEGRFLAWGPLACAAGLAVLDVLAEEGLIERGAALGARLREGFEALQQRFSQIGDVRGLGPMLALELVKDPVSKEPDPDLTSRLITAARDRGLLIIRCGIYRNVLRVLVPLVASDADIEASLAILEDAFAAACAV